MSLLFLLQVVPIPLSKASNALRIFNLASKKLGFEFTILSKSEFFNTQLYLVSLVSYRGKKQDVNACYIHKKGAGMWLWRGICTDVTNKKAFNVGDTDKIMI